jgi:hypothetical protein
MYSPSSESIVEMTRWDRCVREVKEMFNPDSALVKAIFVVWILTIVIPILTLISRASGSLLTDTSRNPVGKYKLLKLRV